LRAGASPEQARLLESQANDGFTAGFDHSGANEQAAGQILGVTHFVGVAFNGEQGNGSATGQFVVL
jgi:hypothetical protein